MGSMVTRSRLSESRQGDNALQCLSAHVVMERRMENGNGSAKREVIVQDPGIDVVYCTFNW